MAKLTLNDVTSGYGTATRINANNTLIETAMENTLSRDGTGPNTMSANLDMNSNRITNLATPVSANDAARWVDVTDVLSVTNITAPSQSGNSGKVLSTNGSTVLWSTVISLTNQSEIANVLNPRTTAETASSVTPSNYLYQEGDPRRSSWYTSQGWIDLGDVPTRTSGTTFTVPGDKTARYTKYTRLQLSGATHFYGKVSSVAYGAGVTTVTVTAPPWGGSIPSDLAKVSIALAAVTNEENTFLGDQNNIFSQWFINQNTGTSAVTGLTIGDTLGTALAIRVTGTNYSGQFLSGSSPSGKCIVLHSGTATPMTFGTNDISRLTIPADGTAIISLVDFTVSPLSGTRGTHAINGTTDSLLSLQANGTQVGYAYGSAATVTMGSTANVPLKFITNDTVRLSIPAAGLGNYANDAAAAAGGVAIGEMYRNGSVLMVRVS